MEVREYRHGNDQSIEPLVSYGGRGIVMRCIQETWKGFYMNLPSSLDCIFQKNGAFLVIGIILQMKDLQCSVTQYRIFPLGWTLTCRGPSLVSGPRGERTEVRWIRWPEERS